MTSQLTEKYIYIYFQYGAITIIIANEVFHVPFSQRRIALDYASTLQE